MPTIFSRIIAGEIPSYKIAEDEDFFAFLDIRPMAKGHTLVVPKMEVDVFFDLPGDLLQRLMPFCQRVAHAIKQEIPCNRIGITVMGLEVPHAHVHLIPIDSMRDMSFEKDPINISSEEMKDIAERIHTSWEKSEL